MSLKIEEDEKYLGIKKDQGLEEDGEIILNANQLDDMDSADIDKYI